MIRNSDASHMQISVRDSWTVAQKPDFTGMGVFVARIATLISIKSGIAASLVRKPMITNPPHTMSSTPPEGRRVVVLGIPILMNRHAERVRKQKFLDSFREEHPPH